MMSRFRFVRFFAAIYCFVSLPSVMTAAAHAQTVDSPARAPRTTAPVRETVVLRHVRPTQFLILLATPFEMPEATPPNVIVYNRMAITTHRASPKTLLPDGLTECAPDDIAQTITLAGTKQAVHEMRQIIGFLDVRARRIELSVRLVEKNNSAFPPKVQYRRLADAATQTLNNVPAPIALLGDGLVFLANIVAHINGDGSMTIQSAGWPTRQMKQNAKLVLPILPANQEKAARQNRERSVEYYLEIFAVEVAPETAIARLTNTAAKR